MRVTIKPDLSRSEEFFRAVNSGKSELLKAGSLKMPLLE